MNLASIGNVEQTLPFRKQDNAWENDPSCEETDAECDDKIYDGIHRVSNKPISTSKDTKFLFCASYYYFLCEKFYLKREYG